MNENIVKRNDLLAQKVIKGLQSRNMSGSYARDRQEALKLALELAKALPEDIPVFVEHLDSHEAYLAASAHMHKLLAAIE